MDCLTPERRSWNMGRIKGRDTAPERAVRSMVHKLGYRFRLHRVDLPGRPDLSLPRLRTVIFVHGCFWHRHRGCKYAYSPKSNLAFWDAKFVSNSDRDRKVRRMLKTDGWRVIVVWECETNNLAKLSGRLQAALGEIGAGQPNGAIGRRKAIGARTASEVAVRQLSGRLSLPVSRGYRVIANPSVPFFLTFRKESLPESGSSGYDIDNGVSRRFWTGRREVPSP